MVHHNLQFPSGTRSSAMATMVKHRHQTSEETFDVTSIFRLGGTRLGGTTVVVSGGLWGLGHLIWPSPGNQDQRQH